MLYVLIAANPKLRKAILANCDDDVIRMIDEILHNLLKGNVPLSEEQLKKLSKHKNCLRSIQKKCKGKCLKSKRRIFVNQSGKNPLIGALAVAGRFLLPLLLEKGSEFIAKKFMKD